MGKGKRRENSSTSKRAIMVILPIFLLSILSVASGQNLVRYVNPLTGTSAGVTLSAQGAKTKQSGNTIPAVCVPFAMTGWTPQTRPTERKCQPPYYYKDAYFSGFRGTHWISGSCTQDYASVTIMPETGRLQTDLAAYRCPMDHTKETATPYFYSLSLPRYGVLAALTATGRCSIMKFTTQKSDSLYLLVVPNSDKSKAFIKIDQKRHEIVGYNPAYRVYQGQGQPAGFSGYFVIRFQRPFSAAGTFTGTAVNAKDSLKDQEKEGAYAGFAIPKGSTLLVKAGTSFTSIEEARKNLAVEIPGWDFDKVKEKTKALWEKNLEKIKVKGGTETEKKIFYTALYHTMQQPRLFNDADGTYPKFSQQYHLATLKKGNYYGDFSMWDIYRAELPLYEILSPPLINDWVRSMILKGQQGGWLPIFPCWNNYTSEMIGDHVLEFIASAYLKGIKDYDAGEAYRLMRHNAFDSPSQADYIDGKGRRALTSYLKYGFVPLNDKVPHAFHSNEQVSRTLEYAYDDYSVAQMAKSLQKKDDYKILMKRAANDKNVFDPSVGLMNGRYSDGRWHAPFYPDNGMRFITEGTPRQYSFYVPQNIPGLATLMGGRSRLESELDTLFMDHHYNHGNEPDQEAPFLYDFTAHPWKSQLQVRKILHDEYTEGPGGISGNDDAGEISAWYIFASMGFYPVSPVSGRYLITSPLFDEVHLKVGETGTFNILTHKRSPKSIYIYKTTLNGRPYQKDYLLYSDIMQGGTFEVFLDDHPNHWGSKAADQPGR